MITVLKDSHPTARKEHICMLCNCKIAKGQRYYRQTCVYDGAPYDFIEHEECSVIARELNMYDDCDEGLTDEIFREIIDEYVFDNYTEDEADRLYAIPYYDKVGILLNNFIEKGGAQ